MDIFTKKTQSAFWVILEQKTHVPDLMETLLHSDWLITKAIH
jgi:hypothetical protein